MQMLSWNDGLVPRRRSSAGVREAHESKSAHTSRGHKDLLHARLGNETWTAHLEGAW